MVKIQEAENQIVIDCQVYDEKPSDTVSLVSRAEFRSAYLPPQVHLGTSPFG
jgi:hypothetical protein